MEDDERKFYEESKTAVGFFLGFLGIIGVVICMALYKEDSYQRKSSIKGWICGFITCIALILLIFAICYICTMNQIEKALSDLNVAQLF